MQLWTIDQLLDHEFPEMQYVIDPIFPRGGILLLHGQQTSGKSQLALGIVKAVAEGGLFLRQFPTTQMRSVYIQMDLPAQIFQERLTAIASHIRSTPIQLLTAYGYHDAIRWADARYTPTAIKALQDTDPQLVVVDSLRRCHKLDENDSTTVGLVYGAWNKLFPGASLVFVSHETKGQPGFKQPKANKPRGSSAWIDDADAASGVERYGRGKGGQLKAKLTFTKLYTTEEPKPIEVVMDPDLLLLDPSGLTARQYAEMYVKDNPTITKHQLVKHLQEIKDPDGDYLCGQSNAYKIAKAVLSV